MRYYIERVRNFGKVLISIDDSGLKSVDLFNTLDEVSEHVKALTYERTKPNFSDKKYIEETLRVVYNPAHQYRLPLFPEGTQFQNQVWMALRQIPFGSITTYSNVAKFINRQGAHRAVASACAANKYALIIPCHRVIPESGHIGEFRWGRDIKGRLLHAELCNQDNQQKD